eukprot:4419926-Pleurochrysis_carterae.AAC.2
MAGSHGASCALPCRSQRALVPRLVRLYLQDLEGVTAWLEAGDLEKALNLMGEVEHASLDRIEAANVLGGIQPATFKPPITIPHADNYQTNSDAEDPVGQVQLRAFATEALRAAAAVGVPVHVCSANWCKEWIRVGLGDAAAAVLSIDSNDIQMADGGNVSSGALVRKVVSPHDKLRSFQQLDESALAAQVLRTPSLADVNSFCTALLLGSCHLYVFVTNWLLISLLDRRDVSLAQRHLPLCTSATL